ncbi:MULTISPECIES: hypothetical protein [unclassified Ruegeria]|uniref:hypothetical protein n=1 Tax=unclassified Ruegeria TaxID=2625375 RepID=UPI001492D45B|nr:MULTISPECIES: hypothetical protein [unclassified Ruegeria]MBO9448286.1 hypothetical protein [Ruegeria sp. R14_0]NOD90826.1 hypothetical protein [Ruegeria sp. HKCCD4318]NOE15999.1 hypothetical protein [Ruegeria sp. HKCCD4318-2]NOG11618.1 hypothetical protein [Ruegeria sp. HKCCD4315]UUV08545.1 hypothetical protein NOR97_20375 [Ruegeria sp. YS9]
MRKLIIVLRMAFLTSVCLTVAFVGTVAYANNDFKTADTHNQHDVSIASKATEFKHDHSRLHSSTDQRHADDYVNHGGECHSGICCVGEYPTHVGLAVLAEAFGQKNRNMDSDIHNSQAPLTPDRPPQIS